MWLWIGMAAGRFSSVFEVKRKRGKEREGRDPRRSGYAHAKFLFKHLSSVGHESHVKLFEATSMMIWEGEERAGPNGRGKRNWKAKEQQKRSSKRRKEEEELTGRWVGFSFLAFGNR